MDRALLYYFYLNGVKNGASIINTAAIQHGFHVSWSCTVKLYRRCTAYLRSFDPFYIVTCGIKWVKTSSRLLVSYYIKWVKTSWTYSIVLVHRDIRLRLGSKGYEYTCTDWKMSLSFIKRSVCMGSQICAHTSHLKKKYFYKGIKSKKCE